MDAVRAPSAPAPARPPVTGLPGAGPDPLSSPSAGGGRRGAAPVPTPSVNPLRSRDAWDAAAAASARDPGAFHGAIAVRELHWFDPTVGGEADGCPQGAWIAQDDDGTWRGLDAVTGAPVAVPHGPAHRPWASSFDDAEPPFYRWFVGGLTNAGFNEVDRHVALGHGDEIALYFEGDRWDPSLDDGRGGPVRAEAITRRRLLVEVAKASLVLDGLGLRAGDRIALNMPNVPEQLYYTEAAKRLGIVYTPVFGGFSDKTLSDRIHDAGARVVLTTDGAYRNAQVVPYKEAFTDPALDDHLAVATALQIVGATARVEGLAEGHAARVADEVRTALAAEITVQRADVMRGVGRALDALVTEGALDADGASRARTAIARALVAAPARVDAVVVVRHAGMEQVPWRAGRDRWHHELAADALARLLAAARGAGFDVADEAALLALSAADLVRAVWAATRPVPLDAEYPCFVIYTSGSTGKPKGVVHVHGGWLAGVAHTMRVAFDARPGDVLYVVADPGWITGQSYMIAGALCTRVTSVFAEGAPTFPSAARFASIIERYGVTIFKAGVTFLKTVMSDPQHVADVRRHRTAGVRVATFCAEPTSPAVQEFAMGLVTPWYINSYWATEHGGIVWTHAYGNADLPLRADAHTWALPWIGGDVWVAEEAQAPNGNGAPPTGPAGGVPWRPAADGEKGEIVVTRPYPYLCRTVWGDAEHFRVEAVAGGGLRVADGWRGDAARYRDGYWGRWKGAWAYTQGDFAIRHADGSFSLHGRSDDVINVSGHRLGTEEIEGAILRDRQVNPDSPVGNAIVVGAPHRERGLVPLAFVRCVPARRLSADDRRRLSELVRTEKGAPAVPADFLEVSQFPETRSGKYVRRMVRAIVEEQPTGDASTLRNPESLDELRAVVARWRLRQDASDAQRVIDRWRYVRVETLPLAGPGSSCVAVVRVTNPPVNALNERALDELLTVVEHLARRDEVAGVVFTGEGSAFVAGADIRQLLEEMHALDDALPLPNVAQLAFRKIEAMDKPCVAAINGVALGGGLEFALACHYRVAEPTARCGLPEIRLNLMPGYGGTQRLPRLLAARDGAAGLRRAMGMILGGRTLDAREALGVGLVDEVVDGSEDALARAVARVRELVTEAREPVLARAYARRRAMSAAWRAPGALPFAGALGHPDVQRLLVQAAGAGRADAARRAVEAIQTGWEQGIEAGLAREARLFAEAVVDPAGGKAGIRAFLDRRATPLPARDPDAPLATDREACARLEAAGELLPVGAPFWPGITPVPRWQYAFGVARDRASGAPRHGEPKAAEHELVVPVDEPGANDALVYVLASEVNFNDVWAITGIPVSPFDAHDEDRQTTGSGGIGLVARLGVEARREGRLRVGDLVTIYSGQSELLSPHAARDPMSADFRIQGYETPTGSHAQFLVVQAPQLHAVPADLTLESAGSYVLNLGTIVRALFTTLRIEPGRTMLVEGAATGTGLEALKVAARNGVQVAGMVSSPQRAAVARTNGAAATLDRSDPRVRHLFTPVPEGPAAIAEWERQGEELRDMLRAQLGGRLADYAVSHAGETAFPRSFHLLADGGTITFYGASSGYWFSFVGKPGVARADRMLREASARAGESALVYYGTACDADGVTDAAGLALIEAARAAGLRLCVATYTEAQRDFVLSLGFGDAVRGVISIAEVARRTGDEFEWPSALPPLPDAKRETARFREAVRAYQERTVKPFGSAVGRVLRSAADPRGAPDLVIERAGHDALGVSTSLVKPFTGRVIYAEEMRGRRYTFYAPQVWTRQRRILMPSARILGTHLSNAHEVARMNEMLDAGLLEVTPPTVVAWHELPEAHQAMWDNRHAGATYVCNHALPALGLRSRDELLEAWASGLRRDGASSASSDTTPQLEVAR